MIGRALCRAGFHRWRAFGGRDNIRCGRPACLIPGRDR